MARSRMQRMPRRVDGHGRQHARLVAGNRRPAGCENMFLLPTTLNISFAAKGMTAPSWYPILDFLEIGIVLKRVGDCRHA